MFLEPLFLAGFFCGVVVACLGYLIYLLYQIRIERKPMNPNDIVKIEVVGKPTREVKEMLTAALKWVRRIEERQEQLPKSFLDNCDPTPLRRKIQNYLNSL